jgi:hypothetical protein
VFLDDYESLIYRLCVAVTGVLLLRLVWSRLFRKYPWFFTYLLVGLIQAIGYSMMSRHSALYGYFFMAAESVRALLMFFVVLEVYRVALASQPALGRYGQKVAGIVMLVAGVVAAAGLSWGASGSHPFEAWIQLFFAFERTFSSWLCILVLLIAAFLAWFPVRMRSNVALYIGGLVIYFSSQAIEYFMMGRQSLKYSHQWSALGFTAMLVALLTWTMALRKRGEFTTTVIGHRWNPDKMASLTRQLDSINATLSRLGRS